MNPLRIVFRKLLSVVLVLVVTLFSFLSFPQVALSQNHLSTVQIALLPQNEGASFPDIQGHWAQHYIEPLASLGIVVGYPENGQFKPDNPVTRTEFAAIINKAFNPLAERPTNEFLDVPTNFWGYSAIQAAYQGGFLEGYPDRKFQPGQNIPRVEVLVSLANGLKIQPEDIGVLSLYADASQIPDYAIPAIAGATERQMVVNYPDLNRLNPNRTATRAEVAAFIYQGLVYSGKPPGGGASSPPGKGSNATSQGQPGPGVVVVPPTVVVASHNGEPNGVFVSIIDFPSIDGQSLSSGQSIDIKAEARDRQGSDLSSTIVWTNSTGQIVSRGSTLTFSSTDTKIETLTATARAKSGQTNNARISFAISPSDIITPPHVKPLPDEAIVEESEGQQSLITDVTGIPGRVCFTNDRGAWRRVGTMPTLRVGDVMLGASATIPPVKILKVLPSENNQSCVEVGFATVEEFFPKRKDGEPFDIPSLLKDSDRIISFNPEGSGSAPIDFSKPPALEDGDWLSIDPSLPSNIGRPYPGIALPYPKGTNPRASVPVASGVNYPSSETGKLPNVKLGTGSDLGSSKWPSYIGACIREEYTRRYRLAQQKAVDKTFAQSKSSQTKTQDYPFERLPSPDKIVPPSKYQFAFDLKSLLEENANRQSPEPIRTEPTQMNAAAGRKTSSRFKSTAQVEHKQELEFLAYLGFNTKMEIPKNGSQFNGVDFKDYKSVIGFIGGNFFTFSMDVKIDETLMGGIAMDGLYDLRATKVIPIPTGFEGPGAYRIPFFIGPIPVWIDFPFAMDLRLTAGLQAGYREGVIGFLQNGYGDFTFNGSSNGLTWITDIDNKSIVGSNFCGRSDLRGDAEVRLQPHIQVLLYSLMGPEVALEPYARLDARHPQTELSIVEPQKPADSSPVAVKQDEEIRLHAIAGNTISIPITASTGVDFAMTPVVINDFIARKIPSRKVNFGKLCLPLPKPPEDTTSRVVWGVLSGGVSEVARQVPECTEPIKINFNPNDFFRRTFTFRTNLVNKQKDVSVDIPVVEPFNRILQGLFDQATLIWTSEKTGESIAASNPGSTSFANLVSPAKSNPGSPVTLGKCSLTAGLQNLRVEAFSPFDGRLQQPLGKAYVPIEVQVREECNSSSP
ncbi:S-layer homology domain-containing protein [Microcoleus sp. Pol10D4]|uniref:S-layer homology domain-containing protein n=1 Tax=Microcoleus sp. Pol10D4 TaxID=3055387 RepID=UPI002FCF7691